MLRPSMDALKSHRARRSPSPLRMRWRRVRPSTSKRADRSSSLTNSDGMRSGLLWSENGSLHIPTPQGHSGDLDVTIHLDSTVEAANLTLGVRGETQQLVTGDSVSLTIASPDQNGTWLDLTPNPVLPKWVTHAVLTQSMQQLDAHELEHENGTRYWFESGWSLHVNGSILFQGVRVEGADATCWGTCDLDGSTMINSAPMHSRMT